MSFFQMGAEAVDSTIQQFDAEKAAREAGQDKFWRFWLKAKGQRGFKPGTDQAMIVFLANTSECPVLYEHNLKVNGKWGNTFFCQRNEPGREDCLLCESGDTPYKALFIPILDRREYTSQKGKVFKDQIRLMVAKPTSIKQIRFDEQEYEGLKFKQFKVVRTDPDAVSIGDKFIFKGALTEEKVLEILEASKMVGDDPEEYALTSIDWSADLWGQILGGLPDDETLAAIVPAKANEFDDEDSVEFS